MLVTRNLALGSCRKKFIDSLSRNKRKLLHLFDVISQFIH